MITVATLKKVKAKNQNYNTQFRLYPQNRNEPIFAIQPLETFQQFTWISSATTSSYGFVKINPSTNRIGMVEGTEFSISCFVEDPSNVTNPNYDKNITYIWRRDGSPLYEINSLNNVKGSKSFYISASECRRDISGTYQLEARNKYGSTFSEPFEIDVINKKYHPILFKNLIVNPCGAKGLDGWTGDEDFAVDEFTPTSNKNQWSIPREIYEPYRGPYTEQFRFTLYGNETRLNEWFNGVKDTGSFTSPNPYADYNRWKVANYHPNLVDTDEFGWGNWGAFFPAWPYIDKANKNDNLFSLGSILTKSETYFTRTKLKFSIYGGKAKCLAYQDIDVSEAAGLIDGETYGVDRVIAHFFAYVGIGISKYSVRYIDEQADLIVDNTIPVTYPIYISGGYAPEDTKPALIPLYTASFEKEPCYCCPEKGIDGPFVYTLDGEPINIEPVAEDVTDVRIDFFDGADNLITSKVIKGPDERDIWAVKEKFFVPFYLGNLYSWMFDTTDEEFRVFNQRYTTMNAIKGVDNPQTAPLKDIHAEWMQKYHYPLYDKASNEYRRVCKSDKGAAAMFGINENLAIPKGTRTIRVNVIFNHKSNVIFDDNPALKDWSDQEIYYDYYTNTQTSQRLHEYGNPRCGITAMHLSLHPNTVDISTDYNTYLIPLGNVWYKRRNELSVVDRFWTVTNQNADVTTLPYIDVRPDTFIAFANQSYQGPASTFNVSQLLGITGVTPPNTAAGGTVNIGATTGSAPAPQPTIGSIGIGVDLATNKTILQLLSNNSWAHYQWQVDYASDPGGLEGTYFNIYDATGSSFILDPADGTGNRFRVRVSNDNVSYRYSEPQILP